MKHSPPRIRTMGSFALATLMTIGLALQSQAQMVISKLPAAGSVDVPLDTSIVITFDVPIEPLTLNQSTDDDFITLSLNWSSNIDKTKMNAAWSAGNTVLTLSYDGNLPGSSTITWEINKPGHFGSLADEETFFPVAYATGTFTTVEGDNCLPDGVPLSYGKYNLIKNLIYVQGGASDPVLDETAPASFLAVVESPDNDPVQSATLKLPDNSTVSLFNSGSRFLAGEPFASQAEMDTAYPVGNYEMTMNRTVGSATVVNMNLPGTYPPTPKITNLQAAQSVNPAANFGLQWESFAGATGEDQIVLSIEDGGTTVFMAPDLCVPIDLPNTATSILIPAGTLQEGKLYGATLSFYKSFYFSTENPAEFLTAGALVKSTQFTINTGEVVNTPEPQLSGFAFNPEGRFTFDISDLQIGTEYRVEFKATLDAQSWNLIQILTPTATVFPFVDNGSSDTSGSRYYQVIKP